MANRRRVIRIKGNLDDYVDRKPRISRGPLTPEQLRRQEEARKVDACRRKFSSEGKTPKPKGVR